MLCRHEGEVYSLSSFGEQGEEGLEEGNLFPGTAPAETSSESSLRIFDQGLCKSVRREITLVNRLQKKYLGTSNTSAGRYLSPLP